jgi:hypothetical protein
VVALLVALAACRGGPPPPSIGAIRVGTDLASALSEVGLDAAQVEAQARASFQESGFQFDPGSKRTFEARLEIAELQLAAPAGGAGVQAVVAVRIDLVPAKDGEPSLRETGRAVQPVGTARASAAVKVALANAIGEAVRALKLAAAAEVKPIEALIADLESSDARVRGQAVQALGERKAGVAVPALLKRLKDPEPKVAHRTVGALAQIKDPRAVPALIDMARGADAPLTLRMIRIVTDIGGRDAEGWLLVQEQAHPDPRVREAAAEGLDELRRSAPPGAR